MRILLFSYSFYPTIGGIETASLILANGFVARGHAVTVVTTTPSGRDDFPFEVVRRPSARALLRLVRDADLVWQNHISLRNLWPLVIIPRPLLITHQYWLGERHGARRWLAALKRGACCFGWNVFISGVLAKAARLPGPVIPNPYDDRTFFVMPEISRDRDVAFLGRLVREKGADMLIDALAILASNGHRLHATVIGDGPEARSLKAQAADAGLGEFVHFSGPKRGRELARELNRHRVLAVPSRWEESFGIVALEGAACGCVVIGTAGGGLPETIGPCGLTVPNGDAAELACNLAALVADADRLAAHRRAAAEHLAKYTPTAVVGAYERVVEEIVSRKAMPVRTRSIE